MGERLHTKRPLLEVGVLVAMGDASPAVRVELSDLSNEDYSRLT